MLVCRFTLRDKPTKCKQHLFCFRRSIIEWTQKRRFLILYNYRARNQISSFPFQEPFRQLRCLAKSPVVPNSHPTKPLSMKFRQQSCSSSSKASEGIFSRRPRLKLLSLHAKRRFPVNNNRLRFSCVQCKRVNGVPTTVTRFRVKINLCVNTTWISGDFFAQEDYAAKEKCSSRHLFFPIYKLKLLSFISQFKGSQFCVQFYNASTSKIMLRSWNKVEHFLYLFGLGVNLRGKIAQRF